MRDSLLHRRVLLKLGGTGIIGGMLSTSPVSAEENGGDTGEVTDLTGFETPQPLTDNSHRFQLITPANRLTVSTETNDTIDLVFEWEDAITVDSSGSSVSGAIPLSDEDTEDIGEHRAIFRVAEPGSNDLVYDRLELRELDTSNVEPGDTIDVTVSARQADSPEETEAFDEVVEAVDNEEFNPEATTEATFELTQGTLIRGNETATTNLEISPDVDHTIGFDVDQLRDEDVDGTPAGPVKGIIINYFIDDEDGLTFDFADDDVTLGGAAAELDLEVVKSREIPGIGQVLLEITNDETLEDDADLEVGDTVTVELSGLDTAAIDPEEFDNNSTVEVGLHGAATFDPIVNESITPDRGAHTIDAVNFEFGDQTGPSEIEDWHDIDEVRNDLGGDYLLVADLDEDTEGYDEIVADPESGFNPIDNTSAEVFTGNFDGNGHEISGLQIDRPEQDRIGLFSEVDGGFITDLTLTEVNISGNEDVGGLVGFNDGNPDESKIINNVEVSGSVSGTEKVGGLVGLNRAIGEIANSHSSCDVTANENNIGGFAGSHDGGAIVNSGATGSVEGEFNTGGFVGMNFSNINDCHATGNVEGETTGGFAGGNDSGAEITRSYATGDVTSNGRAGGFAGGNAGGKITESFAAGSVSGGENAGGFVSRNGNEFAEEAGFRAEITDCYTVGEVTGDERVGGFVGHNFFGDVELSYAGGDVSGNESVGGFVGVNRGVSTVNNVYWDATTAETSDGGTALTTTEMQGVSATEEVGEFDFENTWLTVVKDESISSETPDADGYPILSQLGPEPQLDAQGLADDPDPDPADFNVEITNPADGEEVTEDQALDVDVDVTNIGGVEAEKTIALTAPTDDEENIQLGADETEPVTFEIPGEEVDGELTITVESPDDTDQITVTAVDPCFIATAAYNTPAADEIDVLRDFRDDVLRQHVLGRLFVTTYYRSSPPIARWIRRNRTRRELVKQYFVEPLVDVVQTRRSIWKRE